MSWYWIYGVCVNLPELDHPRLSYLRLMRLLWNHRSSQNILVFTTCFWIGRGIGFILEGYTSRIVEFKKWSKQATFFFFLEVPQTTKYALISQTPLKTVVFRFACIPEISCGKKACKLVVCFSLFLYFMLSLSLRLKKYMFPALYFLRQCSFVF